MKLCLLVTFVMAIVLGRIFGDQPPAYPAIVVDDAHLQLQRSDGTQPVFYELPATSGVVLDASIYKFQIPPQLKVDAPNSVQVLIGRDRQYSTEWKLRDGKLTLDSTNLKPLNQSQPFTGLKSGDTVVFGIGHSTVQDGKLQFSVIWVGMANIK